MLNITRKGHQALTSTSMSNEELWNQRYGHLNANDIILHLKEEMVKVLPNGVNMMNVKDVH